MRDLAKIHTIKDCSLPDYQRSHTNEEQYELTNCTVNINSLGSRLISIQSPTSEDGVMALCLLSSLSCGESLQRAAIISFQTAEEEGVL